MKKNIEIVESLEHSSLLPEGVSETIQNEVKERKGGFLSMLLGTLGASLLGNILAGKGINRVIAKSINEETKSMRPGRRFASAGYGNKKLEKTTTKRQYYENKMFFNAASSFN